MPVPTLKNHDQFQSPPKQDMVQIQPKGYKGVTVDTRLEEYNIVTTYIAGQAWDVDYFEQAVMRDDQIQGFQMDLSKVVQSYNAIRGLELKVTSPLSKGTDSEKKDTLLTGASTVYGIFVPKEGDVFKADIGDGREGLFQVTSVDRMSHYETAPHAIEYTLLYLVTQEVADNLAIKTIDTRFFKKDWMQGGLEPLLHEDSVEIVNNLGIHYSRLMSMYFNEFYSRTLKSLLVPNQSEITYDPFIVRFIKTILSTEENPILRHIVEFNVSEDQAMYEFTLWHCIANMDYALLPICVHEAGIAPVGNFWSRPLFNSVYYSGVEAVIYPDNARTDVDAGYEYPVPVPVGHLQRGRTRFQELNRIVSNTSLNLDPTYELYEPLGPNASPGIRRVTQDNYYVLSEAFYKHDGTQVLSKLETLTLAALKGEAIDIRVLERLCVSAPYWDNVERFYYFPILFALLRVYPRRIK